MDVNRSTTEKILFQAINHYNESGKGGLDLEAIEVDLKCLFPTLDEIQERHKVIIEQDIANGNTLLISHVARHKERRRVNKGVDDMEKEPYPYHQLRNRIDAAEKKGINYSDLRRTGEIGLILELWGLAIILYWCTGVSSSTWSSALDSFHVLLSYHVVSLASHMTIILI